MPTARDTHEPRTRTAPTARRGGVLARRLWAVGALLAFALGAVDVVLPVLPTTPFVLLAAFCFARSSEHLDAWFRSTTLFKQVFETYLESREMTVRAKLSVLVPVTLLLGVAAFFLRRITWMLAVFAVVWVGHVIYFGFVVKTRRDEASGTPGTRPTASASSHSPALLHSHTPTFRWGIVQWSGPGILIPVT